MLNKSDLNIGSRSDLEKKATQIILDALYKILQDKQYAVLGVPGGRSVAGIFALLKESMNINNNQTEKQNHYQDKITKKKHLSKKSQVLQLKTAIDWQRVHVFLVDDRDVPLTHSDSNYKLVKEILDPPNLYPFLNPQQYENTLKKFGGKFDLILLSTGEDGHIASLYPHHHSIENETLFFLQMDDSPKLPPKRLTASKNLLLKSKVALLIFFGESKKEALDLFLKNDLTIKELPVNIVKHISNKFIFTDLS